VHPGCGCWYVQRCVAEVFAGEGDVKKDERCSLGAAWGGGLGGLVVGVFADAPVLWVEVVEAGADVFSIA